MPRAFVRYHYPGAMEWITVPGAGLTLQLLLRSLAAVALLKAICNQVAWLSGTGSLHQSHLISINSGLVKDYYHSQEHILLGGFQGLEVISQEPEDKSRLNSLLYGRVISSFWILWRVPLWTFLYMSFNEHVCTFQGCTSRSRIAGS